MLQLSGANPAGIVIDPKPVTTLPDDPEGQWHGFEVIRLGRELVWSINPFYVSDNSPQPGVAAGIDLPTLDNQTSHCQGFTTLAARAIAAWANLPPEIDQALGYLANLLAAGQAASDQFEALNTPAGVVPEPDTDRENAPDETVENAKKKTGKAAQHLRRQPDKYATAMLRVSQLPNTSLAQGALVGLCTVGVSSASDSHWTPIYTADQLKKICTDEIGYSCKGNYWLERDINIDASQWTPIGSEEYPFRGKLNSKNCTIGNLPDCLIGNLAGDGKIQNLHFKSANITSDKKVAGVVACRMSDNTLVRNIQVKDANLVSNSKGANAGIVVGLVNGGTVFNIRASGCTVTATNDRAKAGIGAGIIEKGGTVDETLAVNCNISTRSKNAEAGIGAGENKGIVRNTLASKCHVSTRSKNAEAGIGAGENKGIVRNTLASKCNVSTRGKNADAGIGAGDNRGTVIYTTAYKCTVLTNGLSSNAGIGSGESHKLDASRNWTVISNTAAFGCTVSTSKNSANAGIGAGYIKHPGSIDKTTAVKCTVTTSGPRSYAGIGAGFRKERGTGSSTDKGINNTRVIESTIKSVKESSFSAINGGPELTVCNATIIIYGNKPIFITDNCHIDSNTACEGFDPRLVRKNCEVVPGGLFGTNAPPTYPTTEPLTTVSTLKILSLDSNITTTLPTTPTPLSSSNLPLSSTGSDTITTPPTNAPTVTAMTASSSVSTKIATPALTESLSPALIAIIATLGAACVVLIGVIGVYTHRNYYRRSSTNAGRNQPMPEQPERRLRAQRPLPSPPRNDYELVPISPVNTSTLPTPPQSHYQALSGRQGNTSALPAPPQGHYQPLSGNRRNTRTLPAPPQSHYQPLSGSQGNTATGNSNPPVGNPAPPPPEEQPVYENIGNYRIPAADRQARTDTATGTTPMASTGNEPTPGQQSPSELARNNSDFSEPRTSVRPEPDEGRGLRHRLSCQSSFDSAQDERSPSLKCRNYLRTIPLHPVITEPETDSDDSYDEPAIVVLARRLSENRLPYCGGSKLG